MKLTRPVNFGASQRIPSGVGQTLWSERGGL